MEKRIKIGINIPQDFQTVQNIPKMDLCGPCGLCGLCGPMCKGLQNMVNEKSITYRTRSIV